MEQLCINGRRDYHLPEIIRCLQVGKEDWSEKYDLPANIEWIFFSNDEADRMIAEKLQDKKRNVELKFHAILLTDLNTLVEAKYIFKIAKPHQVLYDSSQEVSPFLKEGLHRLLAQTVDVSQPTDVLHDLSTYFFKSQYGHRLVTESVVVQPKFLGNVSHRSSCEMRIKADFGEQFQPVLNYRDTTRIIIDEYRKTNLFLEYTCEGNVELQFVIETLNMYSGEITKHEVFSQTEMDNMIEYGPIGAHQVVNFHLFAKGKGTICIGSLQLRYSRGRYGEFTLGGERLTNQRGHEIISFFDPGDFQPPLCVYFGGWRSAGGFEGYRMMKNLKKPMMLLEDSALLGGGFYRGDSELEEKVINVIKEKLAFLGFTTDQLILSGMSMGTHGAIYYGAKLHAYGLILIKPIIAFEPIIRNYKLKGVGIFPTALDVVRLMEQQTEMKGYQEIDKQFFDSIAENGIEHTKLAMVYMKNEDYDDTACERLTRYYLSKNQLVLSKGLSGRHNDGLNEAIFNFQLFYQLFLTKYFQGN